MSLGNYDGDVCAVKQRTTLFSTFTDRLLYVVVEKRSTIKKKSSNIKNSIVLENKTSVFDIVLHKDVYYT